MEEPYCRIQNVPLFNCRNSSGFKIQNLSPKIFKWKSFYILVFAKSKDSGPFCNAVFRAIWVV